MSDIVTLQADVAAARAFASKLITGGAETRFRFKIKPASDRIAAAMARQRRDED